jgi:hypothetical protein
MGWAAATAILVAVGFLALRQTSNTTEALTAMGEIRQVPLTDGSAIALDTSASGKFARHCRRTAGTGPGQNEIYIRGISASRDGPQVSGAFGSYPIVCLS